MSAAARPLRKRSAKGFTLLEIIIAMVIGLWVSALLVQINSILNGGADTIALLDAQYEAMGELERFTDTYRANLDSDTLNLDSLINSWATENSVTVDSSTITVSSTDGSLSFSGIRKVVMTKDGQTITAYFTE